MKVTILGSGTLVPDHTRHAAGHLVRARGAAVLLDCGAGTLDGFSRHGESWQDLSHLALSHFHTDHVGEVSALLFALRHVPDPPRVETLTLLGPPGTRAFLEGLARAHGPWILEPGFPLRVVELAQEDAWVDPPADLRIRTHPTPHTDRSVGYRVETGEGAMGYSGDTGPSPELGRFFAGVELLLAECSHPDPPVWENHLTPAGVAALAREAHPGLLVTVHHYPGVDPARVPDLVAAAGYTGPVRGGFDGLALEVRGGEVVPLTP